MHRQKHVIIKLSALINCICMGSCKIKDPDVSREKDITTNITLSSFGPAEKPELISFGLSSIYTGLTVVDTFLVCADLRASPVLKLVGIESGQLAGAIIPRGEGYGECLGIADVLPAQEKGKAWIYDITLGKIMLIDLIKALHDNQYKCEKEIILVAELLRLRSVETLSDSSFAATSYLLSDSRIIKFDGHLRITERIGTLPPRGGNWPPENKRDFFSIAALVYKAYLRKCPVKKNKYMVAYVRSDRLELYDNGMLSKIIRGPGYFDPLVSFKDEGEGRYSVMDKENARQGNLCVYATDSNFYCLYGGDLSGENTNTQILVFDWNGNPVKRIEFGAPYVCLAVSQTGNNRRLYIVNKSTGEINVGRL